MESPLVLLVWNMMVLRWHSNKKSNPSSLWSKVPVTLSLCASFSLSLSLSASMYFNLSVSLVCFSLLSCSSLSHSLSLSLSVSLALSISLSLSLSLSPPPTPLLSPTLLVSYWAITEYILNANLNTSIINYFIMNCWMSRWVHYKHKLMNVWPYQAASTVHLVVQCLLRTLHVHPFILFYGCSGFLPLCFVIGLTCPPRVFAIFVFDLETQAWHS